MSQSNSRNAESARSRRSPLHEEIANDVFEVFQNRLPHDSTPEDEWAAADLLIERLVARQEEIDQCRARSAS